jgi:bacterioferritin-associated ferredoxin
MARIVSGTLAVDESQNLTTHATSSQRCPHCQGNARSILTNTRTKPSVLHTDSLAVGVGYGQVALLQRCE